MLHNNTFKVFIMQHVHYEIYCKYVVSRNYNIKQVH